MNGNSILLVAQIDIHQDQTVLFVLNTLKSRASIMSEVHRKITLQQVTQQKLRFLIVLNNEYR